MLLLNKEYLIIIFLCSLGKKLLILVKVSEFVKKWLDGPTVSAKISPIGLSKLLHRIYSWMSCYIDNNFLRKSH